MPACLPRRQQLTFPIAHLQTSSSEENAVEELFYDYAVPLVVGLGLVIVVLCAVSLLACIGWIRASRMLAKREANGTELNDEFLVGL